jgi:hypothetical protein
MDLAEGFEHKDVSPRKLKPAGKLTRILQDAMRRRR